VRYVHPDHLGSTNVVTDQNQNLVQTLDYYPYGGTRISVATSTHEKRKFIGQFSDDSGLSYLNARYYNPTQGQFLSEDPSFLAVGDPALVKQVTGQDQRAFLSDPQLANSTSYARGNPITNKDPNGTCPWCLPFLIGGAVGGVSQYMGDVIQNRAAGLTGLAAYAPRSSWGEYNAAIAVGALTGTAATARIIYGGAAATLGSLGQDWVAGRDISAGNALTTGFVTTATGGIFRGLMGLSPAERFMQASGMSFNNLPSTVFRNELRYVVTGETFQANVSTITQNTQQLRSISQSQNTGSGSGRGGSNLNSVLSSLSQAVSAISSALSTIWKK
jgi:RHS repeat-associated protein